MGGTRGDRGLTLRFVGLGLFLGLGLLAWYVSKQDTLLALLLAVLQVVFAVPFGVSAPVLDDEAARRIVKDVRAGQKQAWRRLATSRALAEGRWSSARLPDDLPRCSGNAELTRLLDADRR